MNLIFLFIYCLYNIIGDAIILWLLLFLNTYFNSLLLPSIFTKDFLIEMIFRLIILNVETFLFVFLFRFPNKWYLKKVNKNNPSKITTYTFYASIIFFVIITATFTYDIYINNL